MKKLLFLAVFIFAIAGYGGHIGIVHADTLTPQQAAALSQSLDVMKAKLIYLQMEAGALPAGDAGQPTTVAPVTQSPAPTTASALSAQDKASISATLTSLASALGSIQSELSSNPQLASEKGPVVLSTLKGIGDTLALIGSSIGSANAPAVGSPVAGNSGTGIAQSAPVMNSPTPVAMGNQTTPAAGNNALTAPAANNSQAVTKTNTQTAQVSSIWSFTKAHWPTIAIVLLVIVILSILFWPSREDAEGMKASASQKPMAKPVASTVTASVQRTEVEPTKVTIVKPSESQRKTA